MGGKALKHLNVRRFEKDEFYGRVLQFQRRMNYVKYVLQTEDIEFKIPLELKDKDSFGDLDVIIYSSDHSKTFEAILFEFEPKGFKKNGPCWSFEWDGLQVDLIWAKTLEELNWAHAWYSNGELSAMIGRVFRYYNFKLANNGLFYRVKYQNQVKEFLVSRDYKTALNLLGYNFDHHIQHTFDEIINIPFSSNLCPSFSYLKIERLTSTQIKFKELGESLNIQTKFKRSKGLEILFKYNLNLYAKALIIYIQCFGNYYKGKYKTFSKKYSYRINKFLLGRLGYLS